jgi:hypothetical protein
MTHVGSRVNRVASDEATGLFLMNAYIVYVQHRPACSFLQLTHLKEIAILKLPSRVCLCSLYPEASFNANASLKKRKSNRGKHGGWLSQRSKCLQMESLHAFFLELFLHALLSSLTRPGPYRSHFAFKLQPKIPNSALRTKKFKPHYVEIFFTGPSVQAQPQARSSLSPKRSSP